MVSGSLFILVSLGSRPHLPSVWSLFFHVCGYLGVLSWLASPGLSAVGDVAKSRVAFAGAVVELPASGFLTGCVSLMMQACLVCWMVRDVCAHVLRCCLFCFQGVGWVVRGHSCVQSHTRKISECAVYVC